MRDRDLKKVGRSGVTELLLEQAREAIRQVDLSEGARFLEPDLGVRTACGWAHYKFGIQVDFEKARELDLDDFRKLIAAEAPERTKRKNRNFR